MEKLEFTSTSCHGVYYCMDLCLEDCDLSDLVLISKLGRII